MSDYTVYDSEQELKEAYGDLKDLAAHFDEQQNTIDRQRRDLDERHGVLAEELQGAIAIYERRVSDLQEQRDNLNLRQQRLSENRRDTDERLEQLQHQVDVKLGAEPKRDENKGIEAEQPGQNEQLVTWEQVKQLRDQLAKPEPELTLDPPGMEPSQASQIDKDLKLMAKIKAKEQALDGASQNLKENWDRSKGPKP